VSASLPGRVQGIDHVAVVDPLERVASIGDWPCLADTITSVLASRWRRESRPSIWPSLRSTNPRASRSTGPAPSARLDARSRRPAALLALGCGLLAGGVAKHKADIPILGAAGAIAAIVTATIIMAYPHNGRSARQAAAVTGSISAIDQAMRCGPLRVIGLRPPNQNHPVAYISELAARTDHSIRDFVRSDDYYAAVLLIHGSSSPLPPWPRTLIPLGTLALRPRCPPITR